MEELLNDGIYDMYPEIEEDGIRKIVKLYLKGMVREMKRGEQIVINDAKSDSCILEGMVRIRKHNTTIDNIGILKRKKNKL